MARVALAAMLLSVAYAVPMTITFGSPAGLPHYDRSDGRRLGAPGCSDGFYNISDPMTKDTFKCVPKQCGMSTTIEKQRCPGPDKAQDGTVLCGTKQDPDAAYRAKVYSSIIKAVQADASFKSNTTIGKIPVYTTSGWDWNGWLKKAPEGAKNGNTPQCELTPAGAAKPNGCQNVYTQYMLVYDETKCWLKVSGIPILANKFTTAAQMKQCHAVVMHLLNAKPKGSYVTQPYEQRDAFLLRKPIITCGNNVLGGKPTAANPGYPQLAASDEGGGGLWNSPWTYAENTGMCKMNAGDPAATNFNEEYGVHGSRYGGTVQTEEYGHTIFDTSIAYFDPQGWRAVQWAAKLARFKSSRTPDQDWDCFTSATEYFAAGVENLLYSTRIGSNHKAKDRQELRTLDPNLYCLAARYHETNNLWRPCAAGPNNTAVKYDAAFCKTTLKKLGITKFGPDGNGEKASSLINTNSGSGTKAELKARGVVTCEGAAPTPTPTPTPAAASGTAPAPAPAPTIPTVEAEVSLAGVPVAAFDKTTEQGKKTRNAFRETVASKMEICGTDGKTQCKNADVVITSVSRRRAGAKVKFYIKTTTAAAAAGATTLKAFLEKPANDADGFTAKLKTEAKAEGATDLEKVTGITVTAGSVKAGTAKVAPVSSAHKAATTTTVMAIGMAALALWN